MPRPIETATMAWLISRDPLARVHLNCLKSHYIGNVEQHKIANHYGSYFLAVTLAAWFGPQVALGDIRRMAVCAICGARGDYVSVSPFIREPGFSASGYATPG